MSEPSPPRNEACKWAGVLATARCTGSPLRLLADLVLAPFRVPVTLSNSAPQELRRNTDDEFVRRTREQPRS